MENGGIKLETKDKIEEISEILNEEEKLLKKLYAYLKQVNK
ncbi:hypothetical protein CBC_A0764 [Clostridium botulinum C str. Eklund]|nr:hypothetical protein CBC_A0764 [Clostridium botulinum C str. Eklund]